MHYLFLYACVILLMNSKAIHAKLSEMWILHLVLMPFKLELATELRLERPLSLAEPVSIGDVCDGESRPRSSLMAESGLSGSRSGLLRLTLALFLAALLRNERREFSICQQHTKWHV